MYRNYRNKPPRARQQPVYNIIINPNSSGYSKEKIDYLTNRLTKGGARYFLTEADSPKNASYYTKRVLSKKPSGIIACGGDGTINAIARNMIRRTVGLAIYPLGRYNNIYRSLYGEPDRDRAIEIILGGNTRLIDYGLAGRHFFLGSLAFGLIPELYELLDKKRTPRFGIGWSKLGIKAAAAVPVRQLSIKVDAFKFEFSPRTLNVNLMSYSVGLALMPSCLTDDGKAEISFDNGDGEAIMSNFVRKIAQKKYIYGDEIRVFRGERISIAPAEDQKIYIDGEIIRVKDSELGIEIVPKRIRVFAPAEKQ
nr:hypothetical protein [candidate division Zixibacteria bacterium]